MENFWFHSACADAWLFDIDTSRNVQIRNVLSSAWGGEGAAPKPDVTATGDGILFLEDVCIGGVYVKDKIVFATQLNIEESADGESLEAKFINDGGQVRIFGYKTEREGCVLKTVNGGITEVIGGLVYPVRACDPNEPMIETVDSSAFVICTNTSYNSSQYYETILREERDGDVKTFVRGDLRPRTGLGNMFIYSGYKIEDLENVKEVKAVTQPSTEEFEWEVGEYEYTFKSGFTAKPDGGIRVAVDKYELYFDTEPQIVNDRVMVPLRPVFTAMGAEISFDDKTGTVTAIKGSTKVEIINGSDTAYINGEEKQLDSAAFITDGRMFIPLRFIGESFGYKVEWDEAARTAVVSQ